ncbi:MAG: type II toxin-antitoxin system MqsA family antitoxin [Planctomycetota bacterium]|mgnify:CR=1 FL=1
MKCDLCGGKVLSELTDYTIFYERRWIIVEHVPANVCQQCGEKLFAPETVEQLQKIIWEHRKPIKKIETPVYEFAS